VPLTLCARDFIATLKRRRSARVYRHYDLLLLRGHSHSYLIPFMPFSTEVCLPLTFARRVDMTPVAVA